MSIISMRKPNVGSSFSPSSYTAYFHLLRRYWNDWKTVSDILETSLDDTKNLASTFRDKSLYRGVYKPLRNPDHHKGCLLYVLCKVLKPAIVVETGVSHGHSTVGILSALNDIGSGKLISIDLPNATYYKDTGDSWHDPKPSYGVGWLVPEAFKPRWELLLGSSRTLLPQLITCVSAVDLFYHDSEVGDWNSNEYNTTGRQEIFSGS